jgi:mono/diheme cytochrome c family protein
MRFVPVCTFLALSAIQAFGAAADGKVVYDAKCKSCHAADGSGNPSISKMMKVTLRPLGSADVQAQSDADLSAIITDGKGKMPKQALTAAQAKDVVAYLRTMKK